MKELKKLTIVLVVIGVMLTFSLNAVALEKQHSKKVESQTKLININTATVSELVKLPHIGQKMAERIIEFRKKNGNFKKIEGIMKVKGIGEKIFKKFDHLLTVKKN